MILLNFAHSLAATQAEELKRLLKSSSIERVIEVSTHLDQYADFKAQVIALADACGLSAKEWEQNSFIVNPPSLNYIAVALLTELHGRMGHFPALLRLRPVQDELETRFEVCEIINLQEWRTDARARRIAQSS